jgi:hypothetical protein
MRTAEASIWDTFTHTPGKIGDHSNADRANDHYVATKKMFGLIKQLGSVPIAEPPALSELKPTPLPSCQPRSN